MDIRSRNAAKRLDKLVTYSLMRQTNVQKVERVTFVGLRHKNGQITSREGFYYVSKLRS